MAPAVLLALIGLCLVVDGVHALRTGRLIDLSFRFGVHIVGEQAIIAGGGFIAIGALLAYNCIRWHKRSKTRGPDSSHKNNEKI